MGIYNKQSILDEDVPNIGVEPLKATLTGFIKKYAKQIAEWILNLPPKVVRKGLPLKIADLIELSKYVTYKPVKLNGATDKAVKNGEFWRINDYDSYADYDQVKQKIIEARAEHAEEKESKYLKMYFYNDIDSLEKIHQCLDKTFLKESNAFKINIALGYVTEKDDNTRLFKPRHQYFFDEVFVVRNEKTLRQLKSGITEDSVIERLSKQFPDSHTRLLGVYSMSVKITRLDFPIGGKVNLPDYIKKSLYINGLEDVENNTCFWACMALARGCRRDRYKKVSKDLFTEFYGSKKSIQNYDGFDFVNELDRYEQFDTERSINIVSYHEDGSIAYLRRSPFNETRTAVYLNLYLDHFSYITNLQGLAKM